MHHRLSPKEHRFDLRMFYFSLDLDEIDEVARRVPAFRHNRPGLYSFRDRDHLDLGKPTLRENLSVWLETQGLSLAPDVRIQLVTLPRFLGYIFNPVSFYFVSRPDGSPHFAIAEVGNTFGEMKPYLLREPTETGTFRLTTPKHFYVSPFSDLDDAFDFRLAVPGDRLAMRINDQREGKPVVITALTGSRLPLTSRNLAWLTLKFPFVTLKVIALIHWHALRLWAKGIPFRWKEADPGLQRNVLRPHTSLAGKTP